MAETALRRFFADMLIFIIGNMPSANQVIVNEAQGSGEELTSPDQLTVEFLLNSIMPPAVLSKIRQFDQSGNLNLKDRIIGPTRTGIKIFPFVRTLCRAETLPRFCEIDAPIHE